MQTDSQARSWNHSAPNRLFPKTAPWEAQTEELRLHILTGTMRQGDSYTEGISLPARDQSQGRREKQGSKLQNMQW